MKSAIQAIGILALTLALGISALACPLWIAMDGPSGMPCSGHDGCPKSCPDSICRIDSPYLATAHQSFDTPVLHTVSIEVVGTEPIGVGLSAFIGMAWRADDGPPPTPPTPLYLRIHSFLI